MNTEPLVFIKKIDDQLLALIKKEINNFGSCFGWGEARSKLSFQKHTKSIPVRIASKIMFRKGDFYMYNYHSQFSFWVNQNAFVALSETVSNFARESNSFLSRVVIVKLSANTNIMPHFDFGEYYEMRNRYHLVISSEGSRMISGGVEKVFHEGDLFYFNNHIVHEAFNDNNSDRVHVIFDLLPIENIHRMLLSCLKTLFINGVYNLTGILVLKDSRSSTTKQEHQ
jgi:hypothetical protein